MPRVSYRRQGSAYKRNEGNDSAAPNIIFPMKFRCDGYHIVTGCVIQLILVDKSWNKQLHAL